MAIANTPDLKALAASIERHQSVVASWAHEVGERGGLLLRPIKQVFAVEDAWVVPIPDLLLGNGEIEFDALGQSEPPQSNFLGIAFWIPTSEIEEGQIHTYDAVYFRPFNFRAADPDRRSHAVQYIAHPNHPWFDLRRDFPLVYEQPARPAPDGDEWFHARIDIEQARIRVFVDNNDFPSLEVDSLSHRGEGGVGLWVGPGVGGLFNNLRITPAT